MPVLLLFAACFGLYTASLVVALRCRARLHLAWMIGVPAVVFRLVLLFSQPIQEIDIYRYLWDGAATARGVSPFRYSPGEVLAAEGGTSLPADFQRLIRLRDSTPAMAEVLDRIHYAELPTVYPPVSQIVFAFADRLTPAAASVPARVTLFKTVLLVFDLTTVLLVWRLIGLVGSHPAWAIAYAWCPLVLKEFANSGHLDAIAVCLTTASIWCAARAYLSRGQPGRQWGTAAGALLGLAVGAKLYAIVLLPLLAAMTVCQAGVRQAIGFVVVTFAVIGASLAPMVLVQESQPAGAAIAEGASPNVMGERSPGGLPEASAGASRPLAGLQAFFSRWEMNDFLFMIVVENLRPQDARQRRPAAWFSVVPDAWRAAVVTRGADVLAIDAAVAPFLLARILTASTFLAVACFLLWHAYRLNSLAAFFEAAFLTLAWLWLLAPTQNPWYWTWAVPLLPFARGRAWFAVSGLVFVYYLRFWLLYHWPEESLLGTEYEGAAFFDFVVTWVEYGPWFVWLLAAGIFARQDCSRGRKRRCFRPDRAADRASVTGFTDPQTTHGYDSRTPLHG